MNYFSLLLSGLLSLFLLSRVRRVVAVTMAGAVAVTMIAPPVQAQLGIPAIVAAAANVVRLINNVIGPLLTTAQNTLSSITGVLNDFRNLWEQRIYPLNLINRARGLVGSMIAQFRGILAALLRVNVSSAQLPNPAVLEGIIRNRATGDFAQLTNAFRQTYRPLPAPDDAHAIERDLTDIDDAMALNSLKILKASDQIVDQMVLAAEAIENEGIEMAPGSAPYLVGAGLVAAVKCQAMMQRMIAAAIRQEAARIAHDNTIRKRNAMFAAEFRDEVRRMFKK